MLIAPLLAAALLWNCAAPRPGAKYRPLIIPLAQKTDRLDILNASAIVLAGYDFTLENVTPSALQSALKTNWRNIEATITTEDGDEPIQLRDRAIIHFASKGYQGRQLSLVSSRIEFEMQMRTEDGDRWVRIIPEPEFTDQYYRIVDQIQNRLRRLGYRFN